MALTRKMLKAMGIEDEKIDEIIEAHTETVDGLKEQRDSYKADAEKFANAKKELDEANEKLNSIGTDENLEKYNSLKKEFDDYKQSVTEKETTALKTKAYKDILEKVGLKGDKLVDTILKSVDLKSVELDGELLKDAESIETTLKEDWKDYIPEKADEGGNVETPPASNGTHKPFQIPAIF